MLISISGNMGVGKTTLVKRLSEDRGWQAAFEPVDENPFLKKAYENRAEWNFKLQMYYLEQRLRIHKKFQSLEGTFLLDRSVYEGAEIFLRVQREFKMITEEEFDDYQSIYSREIKELTPPKLLVGLHTSIEKLKAQILKRGRDYEVNADPKYFEALHSAYEDWYKNYSLGPKLIIDCREFNFADRDQDFFKVRDLILKYL